MCEDIRIGAVREVLDEFRRLHKSCHGLMSVAIKRHNIDISPEQSRLLFMIYHKKVTSPKDLAKKLRIAPATLSVRLQRLESAGYLRREIDSKDKRNYVLEVEPKGEELVMASYKAMEKAAEGLFAGFTKEDFQQLMKYMNMLKQNVRNIKEDM